jgi:hypothetical protein
MIGSSLISRQLSNMLKIGNPTYINSNIIYYDLIKCEFELINETLSLMQENDIFEDARKFFKYLRAVKIGGFYIGPANTMVAKKRLNFSPIEKKKVNLNTAGGICPASK